MNMKLNIEQKVLKEVLSEVKRFTDGKGNLPILSCVLLEVKKDLLTFRATDTEISIERELSLKDGDKVLGEVKEEGICILSPKFDEVIKKLPSGQVKIETLKNNQITIKSGKSEVKVNGMSSEDFPAFPSFKDEKGLKLPAQVLKILISETAFAAADKENQRGILKAVHFNSTNGFEVIATDSHRLSKKRIEKEINLPTLNIPAKKLKEYAGIMDDKETVEMIPGENQVLLQSDSRKVYIRLLEGNFPDTSSLIPSTFKTHITVSTKEMLTALDRCFLFSKESKNKCVTLTSSDNGILISAKSDESGVIDDSLEAQIDGESVTVTFNANFAMEALKAFPHEKVKISFNGSVKPIVITSEKDTSLTQLLLPIRTA
jgi:DNA polymerase III subunit beta